MWKDDVVAYFKTINFARFICHNIEGDILYPGSEFRVDIGDERGCISVGQLYRQVSLGYLIWRSEVMILLFIIACKILAKPDKEPL